MPDKEKKDMPFVTKALIVAILAIVVVVISTSTAYFVANKSNVVPGKEGKETKKGTEKKEPEKEQYGETIPFGKYTVNLNEVNGRYLVVEIHFELEPQEKAKTAEKKKVKLTAKLETKKVIVEDRVLTILGRKSVKDLKEDKNLKKLRKELVVAVNEVFGEEDKIKTIRFNSWLIQ